jgi:hypothetical protein
VDDSGRDGDAEGATHRDEATLEIKLGDANSDEQQDAAADGARRQANVSWRCGWDFAGVGRGGGRGCCDCLAFDVSARRAAG